MRHFTLQPAMTTMGGVFYPTGYMVLMFPSEQDAREAARRLDEDGFPQDEVAVATPEEFQREVLGATGDDDTRTLPSAGTEGETARHFAQLARQGHHALIVHAPAAQQSEHIMQLLRGARISYGQKYRRLVIEDLA